MELVSALASGVADLRSVPEFAGALSAPMRESFGLDVTFSASVRFFCQRQHCQHAVLYKLEGRQLARLRLAEMRSRFHESRHSASVNPTVSREICTCPRLSSRTAEVCFFGFKANVANRNAC